VQPPAIRRATSRPVNGRELLAAAAFTTPVPALAVVGELGATVVFEPWTVGVLHACGA
jgi:hypothetical protein